MTPLQGVKKAHARSVHTLWRYGVLLRLMTKVLMDSHMQSGTTPVRCVRCFVSKCAFTHAPWVRHTFAMCVHRRFPNLGRRPRCRVHICALAFTHTVVPWWRNTHTCACQHDSAISRSVHVRTASLPHCIVSCSFPDTKLPILSANASTAIHDSV